MTLKFKEKVVSEKIMHKRNKNEKWAEIRWNNLKATRKECYGN